MKFYLSKAIVYIDSSSKFEDISKTAWGRKIVCVLLTRLNLAYPPPPLINPEYAPDRNTYCNLYPSLGCSGVASDAPPSQSYQTNS